VSETDDDIGYLDTGIVDVILDVDFPAGRAKEQNEGVAEDGISKVADVGGLVWVNGGVFDQDLAGVLDWDRMFAARDDFPGHGGPVDPGVHVPGTRDFERQKAFKGRDGGDDFFGDLAGRLAKFLRQFKGERKSVLTHFDLRWLLYDDVRKLDLVLLTQEIADMRYETAL
jgi:hypothetical protein